MEQKQIIVKNIQLNYYAQESKTESSEIIVLLHGWRSESNVWFHLMKVLSENGYNTIALDLPGFGKSQTPNVAFNTDDYADVVAEFVSKLQLEKAIYIGHSYGGRVLINLAVRDLLDAEKLVLVDSSGVGLSDGVNNIKKILAKIVKPIFKIEALQGLRKRIYKMMGAEDYLVSQQTPFFKITYQNILEDKYNEYLGNIDIPTYLIWGENDKETPVEIGVFMEQGIKGSQLEFILNSGHFPFLDNPEEFEKVLLGYLKSEVH